MDKFSIFKQTRNVASKSLYKVLTHLLESTRPISEVTLRDAWIAEIRRNENIFPDGWYIPPPHGMTVLFATDTDVRRVSYMSLRPKEMWPRDDIFLDKKSGIAYLFASPVNKETGIIGDFQTTLYFGNNADIKDQLISFLFINKEIYSFAKIGMPLSEIANYAKTILNNYGMTNQVLSTTDTRGSNIGHTIPEPQQEWNKIDQLAFQKQENNWAKIKDIINKKRIFINNFQHYILKQGDALTIEPRPKIIAKPHLPVGLSFHIVALFKENEEKELITDFDELFTLAGMDYMQKS